MGDPLRDSMRASLEEARKKEYAALIEETKAPPPVLKNMVMAFLVGGLICLIAQILYALLVGTNLNDKDAITVVLLFLIFCGSILTGLGVYDKIGKVAGAGSVVPISGFANSVVAPALEWKTEGLIAGLCAKLFSLAGPVIVFGVTGSVILGLIKYLWLLWTGGVP